MSIEVSQVNEVNIDLSNAAKGDCLEVVFEDKSRIILVVAKSPYRHETLTLTLPRELLPTRIYEALATKVLALLRNTDRTGRYGSFFNLQRWWNTITSDGQPHSDVFTELLDATLENIYIHSPQIGEELSVSVNLPQELSDHSSDKYVLGMVAHIVPKDPWVREVELAILEGERQLRALSTS